MTNIEGKVALVTGAAGGIGAATARALARRGARLMLTDVNGAAVAALADELGPCAASCTLDVTVEEETAAVVSGTVAKFGRIDIAVLNAGTEGRIGRIGELDVADFDRVIAVNVRSVFIGLSKLMPLMIEQKGGSIIILSSVGGSRGSIGLGPYVASKHAVIGLMRTAALEGAQAGVRVNTVNPSAIDTRMMRSIEAGRDPASAQTRRAKTEAAIPMKRYGRPEEVATMIGYLASDEASFCSGNTYFVDGASMAGNAG